jgi:glycosyltransferase involved in cell wall biosynthesis
VTVGPELARAYGRARRLHELTVSLVSEAELADGPPARNYGGELTMLSVGRVDREKDPLLLAAVLALLIEDEPRWRLVVCGEGDMEDELRARLSELGIEDRAEVRGYVPHAELRDAYRQAHALLHVSLTEGLPQVLDEAFAADLPVVATDVGGVGDATGGAVRLVPAGDAAAAAAELQRVADDPVIREGLAAAGREHVAQHTIEGECARLAAFLDA